MKALYKYPQGEYPYERLVRANNERGILQPELELEDTGRYYLRLIWEHLVNGAKVSDICGDKGIVLSYRPSHMSSSG